MSKFDLGGRRAVALLAALALTATTLAACGDDDDDTSSEPSSVAIEATGKSKGAVTITAPSEADAGPAEFTLTNNSDAEQDGQMAFVAEGEERSDEEVIAELQNAARASPSPIGSRRLEAPAPPPRASRPRPPWIWRQVRTTCCPPVTTALPPSH